MKKIDLVLRNFGLYPALKQSLSVLMEKNNSSSIADKDDALAQFTKRLDTFKKSLILGSLFILSGCGGNNNFVNSMPIQSSSVQSVQSSSMPTLPPPPATVSILAGGRADHFIAVEWNSENQKLGQSRALYGTRSPAFGVVSPNEENIYFTQYYGQVYQYTSDTIAYGSENGIGGQGAAHLAIHPNNSELAVANYESGHVSIQHLDPNGRIIGEVQNFKPVAFGDTRAHWVGWSPHNEFLYEVDLGAGKVFGFRPLGNGTYEQPFIALDLGGQVKPRHMDFHPHLAKAYVLNEAAGTLVAVDILDDGTFRVTKSLSTLPQNYSQYNQTAHIQVSKDGRTLYSSNRGHNSIAVFRLQDDGEPALLEIVPSQGQIPRTFKLFDEQKILAVGNQDSNDIAIFHVLEDGRLMFSGEKIYIDGPTFVDGSDKVRFGQSSTP